MKKTLAAVSAVLACAVTIQAQTPVFTPGSLAVLRVGTGSGAQGSTSPFDFASKQNPAFIDEFNVSGTNSAPAYSMAIPTNGANAMWFNGNAGTEGGMSRSGDRSSLVWSAYSGNICSLSPGTAPSSLGYNRGIGLVTAFTNSVIYSGQGWYGSIAGKTNPRGCASDGTNEYYGCGSTYATLQYDAGSGNIYQFQSSVTSTRYVKVENNALYTTINGSDGAGLSGYPAGLYNFVAYDAGSDSFIPAPLPTAGETVYPNLLVPASGIYTNTEGFDVSPSGNTVYIADAIWGIQKYVKSGGAWVLACNYSVASFNGNDTADTLGGVLDMTVDYSGTNPVIYATTAESVGYKLGNFNKNRVVKIVDTNNTITGLTITNVITLAQAWNTNVGFHSISFVPDLRPVINSQPVAQSVVSGTATSFAVSASQSGSANAGGSIGYQWQENGTNLPGQTAATLSLSSPQLTDSGALFQVVVTNGYGSVTSTPPVSLTVSSSPVAPILAAAVNLTNAIGDNVTIKAVVTNPATTPLSYQWYFGGTALTDGSGPNGEYTGTTNASLLISSAQLSADSGNYYCVVTNIGGSASNLVASLTLNYVAPALAVQPVSTIALSNSTASFNTVAYGSSVSYQWYYNSATNAVATSSPVSGATGSTFTINPATLKTNYYVVASNLGGSVTSSVVTLTVVIPPVSGSLAYTNAGQLYTQSFDTLPVATNTTYNTGNPVTITAFNGVAAKGITQTYSLANPFDFTYPVLPSGGVGGLGLTNMNGWYAAGSVNAKLGASQGDQSTGGLIDYGTLATNAVAGTNRAMGLQSTSTTGNSSFGLKLVNLTAGSLTNITLAFLGEVWRNQPNANTIQFGYYIDTNTNDAFTATNALANLVTNLFVSFPTSGTLQTLDGSQSANQISLGVTNLNIGSWPANAALWLVWQQTNSAGSSQGLAIDNLSFSATNLVTAPAPSLPVKITTGSTVFAGTGVSSTFSFGFTNVTGVSSALYVYGTTNLTLPLSQWVSLGHPVETATAGTYVYTNSPATNGAFFYQVLTNH